MMTNLRRFLSDFFSHSGKILYLSFYISLLFHTYLVILEYLPLAPKDEMICGIGDQGKDSSFEELVLNFELDPGDFAGEKNPGIPGAGKSESSENRGKGENRGSSENFLEKFKGTEWESLAKNLENTRDMRKNFSESFDNIIPNSGVSQKYIQRYRHFEDMVVRDVYPTLDSIEKSFDLDIKESEEILEHHVQRNEIIEEFRNADEENALKLEFKENNKEKKKKVPLTMGEEERNAYLDENLKEPKEKQIAKFLDKYSNYDPNRGDLPILFRELYYKNLQRLAYTFSTDPTYFTADYFEENLNKEDYLRNSMALASKLRGTKTSTEILFTVLDIYEIQERAIEQYYKNLEIQKVLSPSEKKEIRNEAIRQVLEKYSGILKSKNINSYEDIKRLYFKKKLSILNFMEKNTPENYRAGDIYFERGRIYWERGTNEGSNSEIVSAVSNWKEISGITSTGDFLNKKNFENIKPLLSDYNSNTFQIQSHLQNKWRDHLEAKRVREEKLLWGRASDQ